MLSLFTQCKVLNSSADKVVYFARKFTSNSAIDSYIVTLPNLPLKREFPLNDIHINSFVKRAIILDPYKACRLYGIHIIVFKKSAIEMTPIFSKLYNNYHFASCFLAAWKSSSVFSVFKKSGELINPSIGS